MFTYYTTRMSLKCSLASEDIKPKDRYGPSESRSCVKVEVDVLGSRP